MQRLFTTKSHEGALKEELESSNNNNSMRYYLLLPHLLIIIHFLPSSALPRPCPSVVGDGMLWCLRCAALGLTQGCLSRLRQSRIRDLRRLPR